MMKKSFAVILTFVLLFAVAFSGCGSGEAVTIRPVLSAESAKPGDTVQVDVYIDNAELFCSMDFYLSYDAEYVTFAGSKTATVTDLLSELTGGTDAGGNAFIKYTGLTLETLNLDECLLFTATFTVREDAPAGEPFFGIAVGEYCKGDDAGGTTYTNIISDVVEGGANLTVVAG
ncbi:MAG: hypothetical protein IKJ63_06050 [Clostridia bacterium]|nr:hypothetical protein [Clostridia bacterium]